MAVAPISRLQPRNMILRVILRTSNTASVSSFKLRAKMFYQTHVDGLLAMLASLVAEGVDDLADGPQEVRARERPQLVLGVDSIECQWTFQEIL